MVSAYVLVSVEPGKNQDVVSALRSVTGVRQAHARWGQPDIFAFVEVDNEPELADLVLPTIRGIPGIKTAETHIVGAGLAPTPTAGAPVVLATTYEIVTLAAGSERTSAPGEGQDQPAPSMRLPPAPAPGRRASADDERRPTMRVLDKARQTAQRTAGKAITQADRGLTRGPRRTNSATVAATTNCSGISAPPPAGRPPRAGRPRRPPQQPTHLTPRPAGHAARLIEPVPQLRPRKLPIARRRPAPAPASARMSCTAPALRRVETPTGPPAGHTAPRADTSRQLARASRGHRLPRRDCPWTVAGFSSVGSAADRTARAIDDTRVPAAGAKAQWSPLDTQSDAPSGRPPCSLNRSLREWRSTSSAVSHRRWPLR
jgi:hypothetical protein